MNPIITGFAASPDRGRGFARDVRVRWALEEVCQPYDVRLLSFNEMKQPAHFAIQPFGQIPTFEHDGVALFETAAIVLHIGRNWPGLLPGDPAARARTESWVVSATATVEPLVAEREAAGFLEADRDWFAERIAVLDQRLATRLDAVARALDGRDWLLGEFGAADLMLVDVIRRLVGKPPLAPYPMLAEYAARAEARPAFARAFAAQREIFLQSDG